ncbi:MAG: protein kinase [Acidobacteria bacterium]|nr:protein kinase [Acidobacteriota bacterium]
MTPSVMSLFEQLIDLTPPAREKYLAAHPVDEDTRRAVESLLAFADGDKKLGDIVQTAVESLFDELEPPPGTVCGRFRLIEKIARGGMGCLYLAERIDGEVRHLAAVKLLRGGPLPDSTRQRFLQERQILANLSHPNITQLFDAGHLPNGQPYLVMEYVDGVSFDVHCAATSVRERVALLATLCDAVAYAHRMLVVHRDLKPNNILVTRDGVPKLLDFGIAKLLDTAPDATATAEHRLTPAYASPEQLRAEPTGTPTDIYSLGAILCRVVTGQPPAAGAAIADRDLDAIAKKAMRPEPDHRYSSAVEMAEDLRAWLQSLPVKARYDERWYLARRSLRRYWIPVAAACLAIGGLTTGLFVARRERDIAEQRYQEVRQLAAQLFSVEQDIAVLPGGTKAREQIVRTATEYLEKLSAEAGDDLVLRGELADGYRKVADIQGGFRGLNLGMTAEAQTNLSRASALLHSVLQQQPNDAKTVRAALEIADLQSRIYHGQKRSAELSAALPPLASLAARYEPLAANTPQELDFLGGIHQSLAAGYRGTGRPADAIASSRRSVEFQRRALQAKDDDPKLRGNLSTSLAALGKALRSSGDIEGALHPARESMQLLEKMRPASANDFRFLVNLAAGHSDLAQLLADDIGASLGRTQEGIREYDACLQLGREALALDQRERMVRFNTGICAWRQANLLRPSDPAVALKRYNESLDLFRGLSKETGGRDLAITILLSESSIALSMLGRDTDAAGALHQARALFASLNRKDTSAVDTPSEAISRAEATLEAARGEHAAAARIHRQWLESIPATTTDFRSSKSIARRYRLLAESLRASGKPDEAARVEAEHGTLRSRNP